MTKRTMKRLLICISAGVLVAQFAVVTLPSPAKQTRENPEGRLEGTLKAKSKTKIDFNETLIEGKMKAPHGFFIQGRQAQTLVQMVKLRSEFRHKLIQSKYAVRSIVR